MPLSTTAIKRLLSLAIPAMAFGSYCIYHYCFRPVFLEEYDVEIFDIRETSFFQKVDGGWDCSYRLFQEFKPPEIDKRNGLDENAKVPTASTALDNSSDSSLVGCLVADLSYVTNTQKKSGFLTWELALRSENRGFIYSGFFSVGKDFEALGGRTPWESSGMAFEVIKSGNKWEIKSGVHWFDFFTFDVLSSVQDLSKTTINISLPNKETWSSSGVVCFPQSSENKEKCPFNDSTWTSKSYMGFWEQGVNGNQQVIDAIKIEAQEIKNKKSHLHDIWSKQGFDFTNSNQVVETSEKNSEPKKSKLAWNTSLNDVYDPVSREWKEILEGDATEYLKTIYAPWAKKKGTWKDMSSVCNSLKSTETNKFHDLCYPKQNEN